MLDADLIKYRASDAGFDLCGIAQCRAFPENEAWFRDWLTAGRQSSLGYLERNLDKRFDPRRLVEGAQTAVVCAVAYKNPTGEGYTEEFPAKVASYACTTDYHTTIRAMLDHLFGALKEHYPALTGRAFVDTAPLLEKQLAIDAGLGWIGRQSLLLTPQFGSYVLLGELLLTDTADRYDAPFEGSRCGRCRNCLDTCPTGALIAPKVVDTHRCIACHTIEREAETPISLHGWIFGCDACQSCCPYNRKAPMHTNPAFDPLFDPAAMTPEDWLSLDEAEFDRRFAATPLTRSGLRRIRQNVQRNAAWNVQNEKANSEKPPILNSEF